MIPWANFENGSGYDVPDYISLPCQEDWLAWVEWGPSRTEMFLESPMLEIAHERQFAITQQGGDSASFEVEHTKRMDACIRQLDDYFHNFAINDRCHPVSPYAIDLAYCWKPEVSTDTMPSLCLPEEDVQSIVTESGPVTPSAMVSSNQNLSSPLQVLMEPRTDDDEDESAITEGKSNRLNLRHMEISRPTTILPLHVPRALKMPRQRKRGENKLATDVLPVSKKRSVQWTVDKSEDDAVVASRLQSMAARRSNHDELEQDTEPSSLLRVDAT